MDSKRPVYILGSGAVGFPLAAYLANAGRAVIAVRTSRHDVPASSIAVAVQNGETRITASVETISLSRLKHIDGTIVVAAKSYANPAIAQALAEKAAAGPVVILQNGLGVEKPFLDAGFAPVFRCVLYVTGQPASDHEFVFRPVVASPIGIVAGGEAAALQQCVDDLSTAGFPFRAEANIQREVWKKVIINAVFNSICPLLKADNGIFVRDEAAADLARGLIRECVAVTDRLGLGLSESELIDQLLLISGRSDGQLISTLQDLRHGRQTEIEFLNLEIARVAASMRPAIALPQVELLGKMIAAKSSLARRAAGR
jgi:2-dehydropantoate 2-reductase